MRVILILTSLLVPSWVPSFWQQSRQVRYARDDPEAARSVRDGSAEAAKLWHRRHQEANRLSRFFKPHAESLTTVAL